MSDYRKEWMTDDQWECYQMLADMFGGFDYMCGKLHECGHGIRFNSTGNRRFSTFDYDVLTRAVLMAHDRMIRFEIEPSGPGMLGLTLHKRHSRDGEYWDKHPTIEQAIDRFKASNEHYKG